MSEKERTCGECRWWDQGTCDARQDEPISAEAYPCPAFDDRSFEEKVEALVDDLNVYVAYTPGVKHLAFVTRLRAVEEALKGKEG